MTSHTTVQHKTNNQNKAAEVSEKYRPLFSVNNGVFDSMFSMSGAKEDSCSVSGS